MMTNQTDLARWVDQTAVLLDLPLWAEHRPGVVDNFVRLAAIAQLVMDFPLPETVEAAFIFQP